MEAQIAAHQPLSGVQIVEFGLYIPGPYATRLLADLGAFVTKIEPPTGDPVQSAVPGLYEFLNRGKRILALDLKLEAGRVTAHELITSSDVVIESFRPGVADRLGIGFTAAAELRPDAVYCSISGFGQHGAHRPAYDIALQAGAGAFVRSIASGSLPDDVDLPVADLGSGLFAALAIVSSLLARGRSRHDGPVHLDLSMQEVITHLAATRWSAFLEHDDADLDAGTPGVGLFPTADGRHVAVSAADDETWAALCAAFGVPRLAEPPFDTHRARLARRLELRVQLAQTFGSRPLGEILRLAADLPLEAVRKPGEVVADVGLRERGLFRETSGGVELDFPALINERRPSCDYEAS